jgi:hypothetical protein
LPSECRAVWPSRRPPMADGTGISVTVWSRRMRTTQSSATSRTEPSFARLRAPPAGQSIQGLPPGPVHDALAQGAIDRPGPGERARRAAWRYRRSRPGRRLGRPVQPPLAARRRQPPPRHGAALVLDPGARRSPRSGPECAGERTLAARVVAAAPGDLATVAATAARKRVQLLPDHRLDGRADGRSPAILYRVTAASQARGDTRVALAGSWRDLPGRGRRHVCGARLTLRSRHLSISITSAISAPGAHAAGSGGAAPVAASAATPPGYLEQEEGFGRERRVRVATADTPGRRPHLLLAENIPAGGFRPRKPRKAGTTRCPVKGCRARASGRRAQRSARPRGCKRRREGRVTRGACRRAEWTHGPDET